MEALKEILNVGGWTMYGIVLCSVVALTVFLERLWSLRVTKVIPRGFFIDVQAFLKVGKLAEALTLCRKNSSTLAKLVGQGLAQASFGFNAVKAMMTEESARQAYELERGVGVLAMIMTLAPLLGFLGTVLGMVELFSSIAAQGEVQNIGVIAGGVYKALYTTIAGLTVAIPATLFHKYCLATVDRRLIQMEEMSMELVSLLQGQTTK